ncbi:uncharacterized protein LOC143710942 isoform X2 [Siphateles boraxobius]|uniref:uncharacterized protein LOC143710942 isoform X2 n=1 Tax=Siphateles boraxobius TaxID=180520 RepID=UPI0040628176
MERMKRNLNLHLEKKQKIFLLPSPLSLTSFITRANHPQTTLKQTTMDTREQLQELLWEYVVDTLNYIQTVRDFCDEQQIWTLKREKELKIMRDIKDQADQVSHKFEYLKRSKFKAKALRECLKNTVKSGSINQGLEKELGAVLENTLQGLEKLDVFLDAVEKLAVTSPFVFTGQSFLSEDERPKSVRSVITAARISSPLLIHFKRNAKTFFLPSLRNLDTLSFQLEKYIRITKLICERMEKKSKSDLGSEDTHRCKKAQPVVKISLNFSEDSMQKMLDHLKLLCKIRMDQHTKPTLIFQEYALHFIDLFSQCHSRMEKCLSGLEESAVQLDRMKLGASISTVAGSSVGIVGGVLSIVGLALAPVTAGASLGLTIAGVSLGVTSGANSLVTGVTEVVVNQRHSRKTKDIFQQYMDDVEKILNCLDQASRREHVKGPAGFSFITAGKLGLCSGALGRGIKSLVDGASAVKTLKTEEVIAKKSTRAGSKSAGFSLTATKQAISKAPSAASLAKGVDALVDGASAVKILKTEEVIATATKAGLQGTQRAGNIPKLAADLPDIGQLAKGTPLALSKSARAGFIGLNALFIGFDVLFICKESISLAKGSKSEASQLIRSRAALWRSELEDWRKIHDSLRIGITRVRKSREVLNKPFLP